MKKAGHTKCPICKGKGWAPGGVMTLYYSSGRMHQVFNKNSEDKSMMEKYAVYRRPGASSPFYKLSGAALEQQKRDAADYLTRKVLEPCSLCNGKKTVNKEQLLMMILRGEVKIEN